MKANIDQQVVVGMYGSLECFYWHSGDDIRLHLSYHEGTTDYIVTNRERVNELWLPKFLYPKHGWSWSRTIPEKEGIEFWWQDGILTVKPVWTRKVQGNALFNRVQAERIIHLLEG